MFSIHAIYQHFPRPGTYLRRKTLMTYGIRFNPTDDKIYIKYFNEILVE